MRLVLCFETAGVCKDKRRGQWAEVFLLHMAPVHHTPHAAPWDFGLLMGMVGCPVRLLISRSLLSRARGMMHKTHIGTCMPTELQPHIKELSYTTRGSDPALHQHRAHARAPPPTPPLICTPL